MKAEYLALPYTEGEASEELMAFRASVSDYIFHKMTMEGRIVYAPVSSSHHIAVKYGLPKTWDFWKTVVEVFLSMCRKIIVIMLPGWETSTGLMAEIEIAIELGLEIEYLDPNPYIEEMEKFNAQK